VYGRQSSLKRWGMRLVIKLSEEGEGFLVDTHNSFTMTVKVPGIIIILDA
jgi:hypothetical protein